jgi:hypothetical protein
LILRGIYRLSFYMFLEHFLDSFLESPRWHLLSYWCCLCERRHSLHLILLYTVVEGLVPALPTADFVTTTKSKRNIKAKVHKDCETTNIIERCLIKNSKVPDCGNNCPLEQTNKVVCADFVEVFKTCYCILVCLWGTLWSI